MEKIKNILQTVLSLAILVGISTVLYLYTSGYRLEKSLNNTIDVTKTGMISAKSFPEGASVYLNGKLETATNDTVSGIEPGSHKLKINKKGFVEWTKEIEVFPELVTDITAVLVSESPRLEPLTNTGAKSPSISPSLNKLAYFSSDDEKPGIWVIPLSGPGGISLFRSNPTIAIQDTRFTKYSDGTNIEWGPEENQLLVEGANEVFYLVDLEINTAETTGSPQLVRETWNKTLLKKKTDFVEKLEIDDNIKNLAISDEAIWSPDEKKIFFSVVSGDKTQYKVYNFEKPLPIGEKVETLVFETNTADPQPIFSWYSDSFHLIMVEGDIENTKEGTLSLIRIDGTNKAEIYNNTLYSDNVFSTPGGDKVIILTSFKSSDRTDLYTVSIR